MEGTAKGRKKRGRWEDRDKEVRVKIKRGECKGNGKGRQKKVGDGRRKRETKGRGGENGKVRRGIGKQVKERGK